MLTGAGSVAFGVETGAGAVEVFGCDAGAEVGLAAWPETSGAGVEFESTPGAAVASGVEVAAAVTVGFWSMTGAVAEKP